MDNKVNNWKTIFPTLELDGDGIEIPEKLFWDIIEFTSPLSRQERWSLLADFQYNNIDDGKIDDTELYLIFFCRHTIAELQSLYLQWTQSK